MKSVLSAFLCLVLCSSGSTLCRQALAQDLPNVRPVNPQKPPTGEMPVLERPLTPKLDTTLLNDLTPEMVKEYTKPPQPEAAQLPESLEAAIGTALRSNPDIRVADAKLATAQAELDQVRLSVVHEVTKAFQKWRNEKTMRAKGYRSKQDVSESESRLKYLLGLQSGKRTAALPGTVVKPGQILVDVIQPSDTDWNTVVHKHAQGNRSVDKQGNPTMNRPAETFQVDEGKNVAHRRNGWPVPHAVSESPKNSTYKIKPSAPEDQRPKRPHSPASALMDRIKELQVTCDLKETTAKAALEWLSNQSDISIVLDNWVNRRKSPIELPLGPTTVHAVLQAIADLCAAPGEPMINFVVRDYGIFASSDSSSARYRIFQGARDDATWDQDLLESKWNIKPSNYSFDDFAKELSGFSGLPVVAASEFVKGGEVRVPISGSFRNVLAAIGDAQELKFSRRSYGIAVTRRRLRNTIP